MSIYCAVINILPTKVIRLLLYFSVLDVRQSLQNTASYTNFAIKLTDRSRPAIAYGQHRLQISNVNLTPVLPCPVLIDGSDNLS